MLKVLSGAEGAQVLKVLRVPSVLAVIVAVTCVAACRRTEDGPIRVKGAWLVVENRSTIDWRDVSVTVNAYYKGIAARVAAGGRLEAPLSGFVTAFGHRFDTSREAVRRVEVRATDAAGAPVALDWEPSRAPVAGQITGR